jgi:opacity protein-like surface antigen
MGSFKALTMAGVVALGAIGPAAAADLLPPAPHIEVVPPAPEFSGWYLRGDVGVGINQISGLRSSFEPGFFVDNPQFTQSNLGDSAIIGFGVGYQFNNWFRGDFTGEYRSQVSYNSVQAWGPTFCPLLSGRCYDSYNGRIGAAVFLANGYVDLGTWVGVTPFVGVGLGIANLQMASLTDVDPQNGGFGYAQRSNLTNFAWAVHAGVGYSVTPNLKLEMSYRYLDMGRFTSSGIVCLNTPACGYERQSFRIASHDMRVGFRYLLGDASPAPMVAPGPLIRKY